MFHLSNHVGFKSIKDIFFMDGSPNLKLYFFVDAKLILQIGVEVKGLVKVCAYTNNLTTASSSKLAL